MSSEVYDQLSIWIKNKQAMDSISQKIVLSLQDEIIASVFGGFDKLLTFLLKEKTTMYTEQHNVLFNIINEYSNDDTATQSLVTTLPDDCLSYTMKFLTINDRNNAQQCCRLFAITARQEASVSDMDHHLPFMRMVPHLESIIEGLKSDADDEQGMHSLQLCTKYKTSCEYFLYYSVKRYSDAVHQRFIELLLQDNETAKALGLRIYIDNSVDELFSLGLRYLQQDPHNTKLSVMQEIVDEMYDPTDYIMLHEQAIPTICKLLKIAPAAYTGSADQWETTEFLQDLCNILRKIFASYPLSAFRQSILDHGFIAILESLVGKLDLIDDKEFWTLLSSFLKMATVEEVQMVWKSSVLRTSIERIGRRSKVTKEYKACVDALLEHEWMKQFSLRIIHESECDLTDADSSLEMHGIIDINSD
eukprot:226254_1